MILPALYHWSPADRYDAISRDGLLPKQAATVASAPMDCVCLGFDPAEAWAISGGTDWCAYIPDWDLWQVHLDADDSVHIRPEFGGRMYEVQVHGLIPPARLWWVGRRSRDEIRKAVNDG